MTFTGPTRGRGKTRETMSLIRVVHRVQRTTASGLDMPTDEKQGRVRVRGLRVRQTSGRTGRVVRVHGLEIRGITNKEQPEEHHPQKVAGPVAPQVAEEAAAGRVTVEVVDVIAVMTQSGTAEIRNALRR